MNKFGHASDFKWWGAPTIGQFIGHYSWPRSAQEVTSWNLLQNVHKGPRYRAWPLPVVSCGGDPHQVSLKVADFSADLDQLKR